MMIYQSLDDYSHVREKQVLIRTNWTIWFWNLESNSIWLDRKQQQKWYEMEKKKQNTQNISAGSATTLKWDEIIFSKIDEKYNFYAIYRKLVIKYLRKHENVSISSNCKNNFWRKMRKQHIYDGKQKIRKMREIRWKSIYNYVRLILFFFFFVPHSSLKCIFKLFVLV